MPFEINGADGQTIAIPDGEYYFNTKARCRRMMLNSLSPEARQIYACLEIATMGFRQELAVTMYGGMKVLLTNAHIRDQTGLSKQNVRRGLAELEGAGLVERRGVDGGPLHKGKIEIYCWAEPREQPVENGSQRATTIPVWFPTSWEPIRTLITRHKYKLPLDLEAARDYLPAMEEAARDYQTAEKVVTELLERVCAPPPLYKEDRKERNIERTSSSGGRATPVMSESPAEEPPARPPEVANYTRRRQGAPLWHDRLANFLEALPIGTRLDTTMHIQIRDTLSEELLDQFETACKSAHGIRKWSGYLGIAKQVAARGVVKMMAAIGGEEQESLAARQYRESMERRRPKPCLTT